MAIEFPDRQYQINAMINASGTVVLIGHSDDSVVIEVDGEDPCYMDIPEAQTVIAALTAAIGQVGI